MIRTTLLDHDHVDVTSSQLQLALLLQAEGALDEAAGAMERCLATQGGNRHLAGATAHNDYALSASGGAGAGDHTLHPLVAALHHHLAAVALQRADFAAGTPWVIVMGWVRVSFRVRVRVDFATPWARPDGTCAPSPISSNQAVVLP